MANPSKKHHFNVKPHQSREIILDQSGDYEVNLVGDGSSVTVKGMFWLKAKDNLIVNLTIKHQGKHTSAQTDLRAVVDDQAHASINGLILVQENAQQTNSFLSEKVLLLSPKATADAIPNLEINADDVKCSHAATIGPIDPEQLFYLESRGISTKDATHLIAQGFLKV